MARTIIESFLIADAARASGLTPAMLDYLCREKVLVPSTPGQRGRGRPRRYSFGDVVMLRVLSRLLAAGISVQRLKKALQSLRRFHKAIRPLSLPADYLVTDGRRAYLRDKDGLLELDGSGQMSFLFVLELRDVRREVLKAARGS
jgi:DNA-binding transcriptional MerR regulator